MGASRIRPTTVMSRRPSNNMEPSPADFALEHEPAPASVTDKGVGCGALVGPDDYQTQLDEIFAESQRACSPHGGSVEQSLCARIYLERQRNDRLRSALLRTTGSLGLIIGGANPKAPGHRENYAHAMALFDGQNTTVSNAEPSASKQPETR